MFERVMEKEVTYVKKNPLPSQNLGCVYKGKVNDQVPHVDTEGCKS